MVKNMKKPQETLDSPSKRVYHTMLYDPITERVIVFGGQAYYHWGMDLQDVWAYHSSSAKWEYLGGLEAGEIYAVAYDEKHRQAIMLNLKGETWAYSLQSQKWERKNPPISPAARYGHRMVYEAHTSRIILFGGFNGGSLDEPLFNHTWIYEYENDKWTLMEPELAPSARIYHSMVYHPVAKRTLVWGGRPFEDQSDVTMWVYDSQSNTWESLQPVNGPSKRFVYAPMVYCSKSNRVIMFGGLELSGKFQGRLIGETWFYDLEKNRWEQLETTVQPSTRTQHAMVYSHALGKVVVFGGEIGGAYAGEFTDELWLFDPITRRWNQEYP